MLAVTATLTGSNLAIALGAASDAATLSSDGTTYTVSGTGLSATPFTASGVAAGAVSGNGTNTDTSSATGGSFQST